MACFGGAGPQHCCAMARALGMRKILVSRFSGVLSAYGLSAADVVCEKQEACAAEYGDGGEDPPEVKRRRRLDRRSPSWERGSDNARRRLRRVERYGY